MIFNFRSNVAVPKYASARESTGQRFNRQTNKIKNTAESIKYERTDGQSMCASARTNRWIVFFFNIILIILHAKVFLQNRVK